MKLQIVSDLHYNWKYIPQGADALLIAGDFGNGLGELIHLMKNIADIPVFFVLGNHDLFNEVYQDAIPLVRSLTEGTNWTLLENDIVIHKGVRIAGTTGYTNLGGPTNQWFVKQAIKQWPDFQYTKWLDNNGTIRNKIPEDLIIQFNEAIKFLEFVVKEPFEGKTIIMTHFGLTTRTCHPRFANQIANHYFATDCEYLFGNERHLFIQGHTHDFYDIMLGDTRLVCNPVGYKGENNYKGDLIIEV